MKIRVEPGRPVDLDARRRTSAKGGIYDISKLSDADRQRVLKQRGVSVIDDKPAKAPAKAKEERDG